MAEFVFAVCLQQQLHEMQPNEASVGMRWQCQYRLQNLPCLFLFFWFETERAEPASPPIHCEYPGRLRILFSTLKEEKFVFLLGLVGHKVVQDTETDVV